jgi:hypothetical protein
MSAVLGGGSGETRRALPSPGFGVPRWAWRAASGVCLTLTRVILALTRGMVRAGLAGPSTANRALRLASGLTQAGLRAWRRAAFPTRSARGPRS